MDVAVARRHTRGVPEPAQRHLDAADRHDAAAREHERSALFWEAHGEAERAELQHDLAVHERAGATLERRWAALIERDGRAGRVVAVAERQSRAASRRHQATVDTEVAASERAARREPPSA